MRTLQAIRARKERVRQERAAAEEAERIEVGGEDRLPEETACAVSELGQQPRPVA